MTKNELIDWVRVNGCSIEPLPIHKADVIRFFNPETGGHAFIELPIDERQMKDITVFRICNDLDISALDITLYIKSLNDRIDDFHNLKKRKN